MLAGCAVAHALLFVAAFPPVNLWFLIALAPAPLAWIALRAPSMRSALMITFLAQLAIWFWLGRWLVQITELGYPFYAPYLALFGVLFTWIIRRLYAGPALRLAASLPLTLTLPTIWVGIEFLRGSLLFSGYPWYLLAHPLVEQPALVQSADLLGAYFISFLAAMVSGALVDLARQRAASSSTLGERAASSPTRRSPRHLAVAVAALALLLNVAYGVWRLRQSNTEQPGPTMLVVQTNLPQDNKMRSTPEERLEQFERFMFITLDGLREAERAGHAVDLIVWPETMAFGFGFEQETIAFLSRETGYPEDWNVLHLRSLREMDIAISQMPLGIAIAATLREIAADSRVPMLIGSPAYLNLRRHADTYVWDAVYNSAYLLDIDGSMQRYDKIHLTPFGETMPYISNWPWLEERLLALAARGMRFELDPGERTEPLLLAWNDQHFRMAAPICFEITMPHISRRLVYEHGEKQADVLINLSNDGWFGWHDAGRTQHAQISRFRAIENRVPVVRSVNTGHSVLIDAHGRLVAGIGEGRYGEARQPGSIIVQATRFTQRSLYGRIGDVFAWLCLVATLAVVIAPRLARSSPEKGAWK